MPQENIDPKLEKRIQKSFEAQLKYHERKAGGGAPKPLKESNRPRRAKRVSLDPEDWDDDEFVLESQPQPRPRRAKQSKPKIDKTDLKRGVLTQVASRRGEVRTEEGEDVIAFFSNELASSQRTELAIGDEVLYEERGDVVRVVERCARRTVLMRPDPQVPEQGRVIVANVDRVGIVVATGRPPLRPGLVDRYLIAIERGLADATIIVNKIDIATEQELAYAQELLEPYRVNEVPIFWCSAERRVGLEDLKTHFDSQRIAFVGHSGVGKSSLANALDPELDLAVGHVADYSGKGRHTTTGSTLYSLGRFELIDTPGIREFGLFGLTAEELAQYFHEFEPYRASCEFSDCTHREEPRCSVREAVSAGEISGSRYAAYLSLRDELQRGRSAD